jgi:MFS family permease
VLFANLASLLAGYSLFSIFVLVPHYVQLPAPHGFGTGAIGSGLFLLPAAFGLAAAGPLSGIYAPRVGAKWPYSAGMALITTGAALLAGFHDSRFGMVAGVLLLGLGFGGAVGSAATLVASSVSEEETGVATSLNTDLRLMGGGVGAQLATVIMGTFTVAHGLPSDFGFTIAFLAAMGVAAIGTVAALLVPSGG